MVHATGTGETITSTIKRMYTGGETGKGGQFETLVGRQFETQVRRQFETQVRRQFETQGRRPCARTRFTRDHIKEICGTKIAYALAYATCSL